MCVREGSNLDLLRCYSKDSRLDFPFPFLYTVSSHKLDGREGLGMRLQRWYYKLQSTYLLHTSMPHTVSYLRNNKHNIADMSFK